MKSQYVIETGALTGVRMDGSDTLLALNTAPGTAWVDGDHDARNQRCVVVDGEVIVVPWQPEQPPESGNVSWVWDAITGLWLEVLKLPALKVNARQPYLRELATLDGQTSRAVAEILEAQLSGEEPPAAAVERLRVVNAAKGQVRERLAAIEQAQTPEELAQVGR